MNLQESIRNDDIKSLQKLINIDNSVNLQYGDMKNTALHIASIKGHTKAAEILIDAGADLNIKNKRGAMPIHLAVTYHQPMIIDLLLSREPSLFQKVDGNGNSLLHIAVWKRHIDIVDYLLKNGASMGVKNKEGNTAYHMAVLWNRPHILKTLLKYNTTGVDDMNFKGLTALHLASTKNYEECVQCLLMYGASPSKRDKIGKTPKDCSTSDGVKKLYAKYDLYKSIKSGCSHGMAAIIARRKFDIDNSSALHIASLFSVNRLLIQQLVSNGSKVNGQDNDNKTALYYAIQAGCIGSIQILLSSGAALSNIRTNNGQSPLHISVQRQDFELTKLLLKYKANVNIQDKNGDTPLLHAVINRSKKMVNLLIKHGADVCQTDRNGNTPLHLAVTANSLLMSEDLLPYNRVVIDTKNKYGHTPLMCAILGRNVKLTKLLIDNGADLYTKDKNEKTAYMIAVGTNDEHIMKLVMEFGNDE